MMCGTENPPSRIGSTTVCRKCKQQVLKCDICRKTEKELWYILQDRKGEIYRILCSRCALISGDVMDTILE